MVDMMVRYNQTHAQRIRSQDDVALTALSAMAFASFFIPSQYAIGKTVQDVWMAANAAICLICIALFLIRCKFNKRWLLLSAFYFSYFILSNFFYGEKVIVYGSLYRVLEGVGFASLCEYLLSRNYRLALKGFVLGASVMCALHVASFVVYRDVVGGMAHGVVEYSIGRVHETQQNWYFLTYDNNSIFYFLPLLCAVFLYGHLFDRRANKAGLVLCAVVAFLYLYHVSAAAIASVALFAVLMVLGKTIGVPSNGPLLKIVVLSGFLFVALIVVFVSSEAMSNIALFFGKTTNLGGRDVIWANSIAVIQDNWLFGVGQEDTITTYLRIRMSHCHNILLELLYEGGAVSFLFYLAALLSFDSRRGMQACSYCSWILLAGIAAYFVASGLDWFARNPLILFVFYLYFYIPQNEYVAEDHLRSNRRAH